MWKYALRTFKDEDLAENRTRGEIGDVEKEDPAQKESDSIVQKISENPEEKNSNIEPGEVRDRIRASCNRRVVNFISEKSLEKFTRIVEEATEEMKRAPS